jgi:hypothetical protein
MTGTTLTQRPTVRSTVRPAARHVEAPEVRATWGVATIVAAILSATGITLAVTGLLSLAALALLAGLSAGIAAVRERPRRPLGWLAASAAGVALVAVTIAGLILRP